MSQKSVFTKEYQGTVFELPVREEPKYSDNTCEVAYPFEDWCRELIEKTGTHPSEALLNRNLLRLQHRYFERYEPLSSAHKGHASPRSSKRCVHDIYRETYHKLNEIRLTQVRPPILRKPPKPPPPPPPQPKDPVIHLGMDDLGTIG